MNERHVNLEATDIAYIAGRRYLLKDISFRAHGGETIAIVGRNGAGKTTLLSVLAGLLRPDRGEVKLAIDGALVRSYEAFLAFQPHELFLYPDLTVFENLLLFAQLYRAARPVLDVQRAIEQLGLQSECDTAVRRLSRGMQQLTAIGRLLVTDAPVWLMDEPTTGLDSQKRRWFCELIRLESASGRLVIMASHDQVEIEDMASRILVLEGGRLAKDIPQGKTNLALEKSGEASC